MAYVLKKTDHTKCWRRCEAAETPLGVEMVCNFEKLLDIVYQK